MVYPKANCWDLFVEKIARSERKRMSIVVLLTFHQVKFIRGEENIEKKRNEEDKIEKFGTFFLYPAKEREMVLMELLENVSK